jgi:hypothetical protein
LSKDYINIAKFANIYDEDYRCVRESLKEMSHKAAGGVSSRWLQAESLDDRSLNKLHLTLTQQDFRITTILGTRSYGTFVGRQNEMARLEDLLFSNAHVPAPKPSIAVEGPGGIGKTEFVHEFVQRHQEKFSTVVWIHATSREAVYNDFARFLQMVVSSKTGKRSWYEALGVQGFVDETGRTYQAPVRQSLMKDAVKEWLERRGNDRWLLVFDELDQENLGFANDWVPEGTNGFVIFIGRCEFNKSLWATLQLGSLKLEEAMFLLCSTGGVELLDGHGMCVKPRFSMKLIVEQTMTRRSGCLKRWTATRCQSSS